MTQLWEGNELEGVKPRDHPEKKVSTLNEAHESIETLILRENGAVIAPSTGPSQPWSYVDSEKIRNRNAVEYFQHQKAHSRKRKARQDARVSKRRRLFLSHVDDDDSDAEGGPLLLGVGHLIPPEIKEFDMKRDGHLLENAVNPLEEVMSGELHWKRLAETNWMAAQRKIRMKSVRRDHEEHYEERCDEARRKSTYKIPVPPCVS